MRRIFSILLALSMLLTLAPIAFAENEAGPAAANLQLTSDDVNVEDVEDVYLTFNFIISEDSGFISIDYTNKHFPAINAPECEYLKKNGASLTVTKPDDVIDDDKYYVCAGFIASSKYFDSSKLALADSTKEENIQKFNDSESVTVTLTNEDVFQFPWGSEIDVAFFWKETEKTSYEITYDFTGPNNSESYPVIAKFSPNAMRITEMSSVGFFTVTQDEEWTNLIRYDGDDVEEIEYHTDSPGGKVVPSTEAQELAVKIENNQIKVKCFEGTSSSLPKMAQHRMPMGHVMARHHFYPVIGYVAREKTDIGYKYYRLAGWSVGDSKAKDVDGIYGSYEPDSATTLKAYWEEITLTDTAADAPEFPLLSKNQVAGGEVYLKLEQKAKNDSVFQTGSSNIGSDGELDYGVTIKASDFLKTIESTYFKWTDEKFAVMKLNVHLDSKLAPAVDTDGFTTFNISGGSPFLKPTGVEINSEALGADKVNTESGFKLKAKLDNAKDFTLVFAWSRQPLNDFQIQIPTKAVEGQVGTVSGTKVSAEFAFNFAEATGTKTLAAVEPEQLARYLLALDETWNQYYYGENNAEASLEKTLQAAKNIEEQLKNVVFDDSNTLRAEISEKLNGLTLDKDEFTVNVGDSETVNPIFDPSSVTNKYVTWSVDEAGKDIVSISNGKITGVKPGKATVTCTSVLDAEKTATVEVTVNGLIIVEPTPGGTVTVDKTSATKDEAVTVTVTPETGFNLVDGTLKVTGVEELTNNEDGTYTFKMPETSPVYIGAAFINEENTVVNSTTTEVSVDENSGVGKYANKGNIEVKLSEDAVNELVDSIDPTTYSAEAAKAALSEKSVDTESGTVYRHIQTKADVTVKNLEKMGSALGHGKLTIDIEFKYRVVASTVEKPGDIKIDDETGRNAVVMNEQGDDDGWKIYKTNHRANIVVPLADSDLLIGKPGDWVKAVHIHEGIDYTKYLQIQPDGTVVYLNDGEGNSIYTFEAVRGVKDILFDNRGTYYDIDFVPDPDKSTYSFAVSSDVDSLTMTPQFSSANTSGLVNYCSVTFNGTPIPSDSQNDPIYTLPLVNGKVNTVEFKFDLNNDHQTFTVNITRGTPYNPAPTPSTYSIKTEAVENVTVETSATTATAGTEITVTVTPAENYHVSGVAVTASNGAAVEVTDNEDGTYSFKMPASNVTVKAEVYECPSMAFPDIDLAQWYHPYTDYAISHGLMEGTGVGFEPETLVTRAEMAGILWNLEGQPEVEAEIPFPDVPEDEWYTEAIRWAASVGIIKGYDTGKFGPNDTITREQMATMLYNYEQKLGTGGFAEDETFDLTFDDADQISDWASEAVAWCAMKEVIKGDNNKFNPSGLSQRAQLATILALYDQLAK